MRIEHVKILPPKKGHQLATAEVILSDGEHTLLVRDFRVLRSNRAAGPWIGSPEYAVAATGSQNYEYRAVIEMSPRLTVLVRDAVLKAYHAKTKTADAATAPTVESLKGTSTDANDSTKN